jgi:hypothetical protein
MYDILPDVVSDIVPDIASDVVVYLRCYGYDIEVLCMGVDMHPYCCYVNVVKLRYINHQNQSLPWHLTWLDGLAVEHA